jgi:hypothetical protein
MSKPYPSGFRAPPQHLTRWRVSFADGHSVVVMATDPDAARRAGAFFSFGAITDVEVVS